MLSPRFAQGSRAVPVPALKAGMLRCEELRRV